MNAKLSSAQRLERCLRGQPIDRVPIWMLYNAINQQNPWYPNSFEIPSYAPVLQKVLEETDIFQRHWFSPGIFYCSPNTTTKTSHIWRDQGYRMYETRIDTPAGPLVAYTRQSVSGAAEKKPLISELDDLDKIFSIPYKPFYPDLHEFRSIQTELGERGLMMVNLCDPLSLLYFHCEVESLLQWIVTEGERLTHFLDIMFERLLMHLKYLLEESIGPVFFIVGSEFACPPMVSPQTFRNLVVRYDKPLIAMIHQYDALAIVHHHGAAQRILTDLLDLQPDGIHPLEAPPVGDTLLITAKEALGRQVSLVGNIQYDILINGSSEQLTRELAELFKIWKPYGRFILAPTAGPYLDALTPKAVSNHLLMIQQGIELGSYDK